MKHYIVEHGLSGHHVVHTQTGKRVTSVPYGNAQDAQAHADRMHESAKQVKGKPHSADNAHNCGDMDKDGD